MKKKKLFRRINRLGTLCALSGVLVLAACTEEEATESQADGAAIRFDVGLSETWESGGFAPSAVPAAMSSAKCPDTRTGHGTESSDGSGASARRSTASNITVTVIDGLPPRTKAAGPRTRGAKKVGNNADNGEMTFDEAFGGMEGFGVLGYAYDEGESIWWTYITNTQITNKDGDNYWGAAEGQACNWPGTWRNCRMRFFAYAPYDEYADEADAPTLEQNTDGNLTIKIPYETPVSADDQKEFLVAATNVYDYDSWSNWGDDDAVNLNFTHTLTAVRFVFTFTERNIDVDNVKVFKIEFNGYANGTYCGTYDNVTGEKLAEEWNKLEVNTLTLEISNGKMNGKKNGEGHMEWYWPEGLNWKDYAPEDFFLMIPQIPPSNNSVTIYFNNDDTYITVDLPTIEDAWQPNTTVIYHLSVSLETLNGEL